LSDIRLGDGAIGGGDLVRVSRKWSTVKPS